MPVGEHLQPLYSRATTNGVKVSALQEELLATGRKAAEYAAGLINTGKGEPSSPRESALSLWGQLRRYRYGSVQLLRAAGADWP